MIVLFESAEKAEAFVKDAASLPFDINIADGSHIFDAKSIMAVLSLDFRKKFHVQSITGDMEEIVAFNDLMRKYEWKEQKS